MYQTDEDYQRWESQQRSWIQDENKEYVETKWFRIERYECTLVKRDRNLWNDVMPQIIRFWEDVERYRLEGVQELQTKVESKRYKKPVTFINTKECMID